MAYSFNGWRSYVSETLADKWDLYTTKRNRFYRTMEETLYSRSFLNHTRTVF